MSSNLKKCQVPRGGSKTGYLSPNIHRHRPPIGKANFKEKTQENGVMASSATTY